jgi:hypothetical protein
MAWTALGGVALYPVLATERLVALVGGIGGLSLVLLSAAVALRAPGLLTWAVAVCGTEYAVFLGLRGGTVDRWAPLVAAALFLAAELGYRTTESSDPAAERSVVLRAMLWLGACVAGVAALGAVLLAAAGGAQAGLGLEALGVAAAVVALALVVVLVARTTDSS